jgi:hypothetical protein
LIDGATIQDSSAVPRVNAAVDRIHAQENNRLTNACELKPDKLDISLDLLSDRDWTTEKTIDELQCNLALAEQIVTDKSGLLLTIRKYHSQCRKLAPWIPVAIPTPEYLIYASDLKPEVKEALEKIHHPDTKRIVLHQAVLRLFEAVGFAYTYISIGRKLVVKLIGD